MIQGLRTVIYPVGELTAAKNWYASVIGHEPYFDQPFYVGFSVGGFELGLIPDQAEDGAVTYWGVPEIVAELDRVVQLGGVVHQPVTDVGGGIKVASVKDPFGNLFGLIENPYFKPQDVR